MTLTNKTRHIEWHKSCRCICRLDRTIFNKKQKQRWNKDGCRCECKELIDKGVCDKGYFLILVIVNANVINLVILVNIWII